MNVGDFKRYVRRRTARREAEARNRSYALVVLQSKVCPCNSTMTHYIIEVSQGERR